MVLVLTNVSDEAVSARLDYDLRPYGLGGDDVSLSEITPEGPRTDSSSATFPHDITIPARTVTAWEARRR